MTKVFYHGTSTHVNIKDKLLPPIATDNLREIFRKKLQDKVFVTDSKVSAEKYAKKAVAHFGGDAVIYTVKPDYYSLIKNGTEYTTDYAIILNKEIKGAKLNGL